MISKYRISIIITDSQSLHIILSINKWVEELNNIWVLQFTNQYESIFACRYHIILLVFGNYHWLFADHGLAIAHTDRIPGLSLRPRHGLQLFGVSVLCDHNHSGAGVVGVLRSYLHGHHATGELLVPHVLRFRFYEHVFLAFRFAKRSPSSGPTAKTRAPKTKSISCPFRERKAAQCFAFWERLASVR